jgi:hypothetical protein
VVSEWAFHEAGDALEVQPAGPALRTTTGGSQRYVHGPPVIVVVPPFEPAPLDQAIDHPRRRRAADEDLAAKFRHA